MNQPSTPGQSRLSNPASERVRRVARLAGRSARLRSGAFLAEGPQAVREAVPAGVVRELYHDSAAAERHPETLAAARGRGVKIFDCTDDVLAALSDTVSPQGLVAVCDLVGVGLSELVEHASGRGPSFITVLSQVRDPGNAGTVIRATDAAGGSGVILTAASVDPLNPKCVRSTAGSLFHVDISVGDELGAVVGALRGRGMTILAADGAGEMDLDDLMDHAEGGSGALAGPVAWIFGNEAWGLSDEDAALADHVVRVPVHGRAESLNLGTAATVCLYATARAHRRLRRT